MVDLATFFGALALLGAAGPSFFKSGPFAYHGLLAFCLPVVIWGGYLSVTSWFMIKALDRAAAEKSGAGSAVVS